MKGLSNAGNVQRLAAFGRTSAAELPLTGSAEFNEDYVGFTPTRRVNGRASLDVDFAAATISGPITNRVLRLKPDNTFLFQYANNGRNGIVSWLWSF